MISYKVAWNLKMRNLLCVWKKRKKKKERGPTWNGKLQSCMKCENEMFIVYVDEMKALFKKEWLRKKKD